MLDTKLYSRILGIVAPWSVDRVELSDDAQVVTVHLQHDPLDRLHCPACGRSGSCYDHRNRQWHHLDTCKFTTILSALVPRVHCPEHGVRQINVPWAGNGSSYTAVFEALVIDPRKATSTSRVAALVGLGWDAVDGIICRAVTRSLWHDVRDAPSTNQCHRREYQQSHRPDQTSSLWLPQRRENENDARLPSRSTRSLSLHYTDTTLITTHTISGRSIFID